MESFFFPKNSHHFFSCRPMGNQLSQFLFVLKCPYFIFTYKGYFFPGLSMLCCHHFSFRDLNILSIAFWLLCFYLKVSWLSNWINVWSLILSTLDAFLSFSFSCFFQKLILKGLDVLLFVFALPGIYKYFCIFELISIIPF